MVIPALPSLWMHKVIKYNLSPPSQQQEQQSSQTFPCKGLDVPWKYILKGGVRQRKRLQSLSTKREEQGYIKFLQVRTKTSNILKKINRGMKSATRECQGSLSNSGVDQEFLRNKSRVPQTEGDPAGRWGAGNSCQAKSSWYRVWESAHE